MRAGAWLVVVFVLVFAVAGEARAADSADAAHASFELAEREDAAFDFAPALEHYRAAVAANPSSRDTPRASARAELLSAHSEGAFAPFARLERVRRDPATANDPEVLAALAREADAFPPGLVRGEARLLVGEAYVGRLSRPRDGVVLLRRIVEDPAADPLTARQARRMLVDTLVAAGDLAAALEAANKPVRGDVDTKMRDGVARKMRRRSLHAAAIGVLVVFGALAAIAVVRARRRAAGAGARAALADVKGFARLAVLFGAWAALTGGALASEYEAGNARPFLVFGVLVVPVVLVARAWGATGATARAARAARALVGAGSVVATAFLLLESLDVTYLEGFGL